MRYDGDFQVGFYGSGALNAGYSGKYYFMD